MAASKRRKSVMAGGSSSSRKGDSTTFDLNSVLAFTADSAYNKDSHMLAFYRLAPGDPGCTAHCVQERNSADKSGDKVAAALGFPSAFVALDLSDKGGAWHGDGPRLKALGEDPEKQNRCSSEGATAPAGLKNLGATCYLNSLLQYLFFNRDFRSVCLNIRSEHAAVCELQRVFALMAAGERCAVDPTEFAKALELDTREEADVSEFSSLLLDFLERYCVDSVSNDNFNFIQALFQGKTSQILVCQENRSHRVDVQPEPFLMLQARLTLTPRVQEQSKGEATVVNSTASDANAEGAVAELADQPAKRISGSRSRKKVTPPVRLEQLLQDTFFPDEVLEGWQCPHCKKKVDALKMTRLIKAPPYLHVTIERSIYDFQKDARKKLNNAVSFPKRLELRVHTPPQVEGVEVAELHQVPTPLTASSMPAVAYECIGYMEHVSDSAHSGHYTATLFDEDANVVEALSLAAKADGAAEEPATKRRRHSGTPEPDAAAGGPFRGAWWKLDDDRIGPIVWKRPDTARKRDDDDGDSVTGGVTPPRIQSSEAYLVLYRRLNHKPGQLARDRTLSDAVSLPPNLSQFVSSRNGAFKQECTDFKKKTTAITEFLAERQEMVTALAEALKLSSTSGGDSGAGHLDGSLDLSSLRVVPTRWLNDFLRGEDCSNDDLLNGEKEIAPVVYGQSLVRSQCDKRQHAIDPLAVWCGEVKLLPSKALEQLAGRCRGFDVSLFLSAEEALHPEMCESLWQLYKIWCEEFRLKTQIIQEGKASKGSAEDAVWVSSQVYNAWSKTVKDGDANSADKLWAAFLKEATSTRWAKQGVDRASSKQTVIDEEPPAKDKHQSAGTWLRARSPANPCLTALVGGLTCMHGLVNRPKAGVLIKLCLVVDLMAIARQKAEAYRRLWPESRRVPVLVSGLAGEQLLSADDICKECGPATTCSSGAAASGSKVPGLQRTLLVRRRYPTSNVVRKQGEVTLPSDGTPITASLVRDLIQKELGQPVLSLFADAGAQAKDVELHDNEIIGEEVESVIMIKEENATSAERETAAFKGSVFCRTRGN